LLSGGEDKRVCLWELVWDYDFPDPVDWHEGARPYLEVFLTLHPPRRGGLLRRRVVPSWSEEEFQQLLTDLSYRGFGWLRPEGVRKQLERMARSWTQPPALG
jgi:hypothetical protein